MLDYAIYICLVSGLGLVGAACTVQMRAPDDAVHPYMSL
jgi:hypothetical protein